jgi:hypothetical protein
MASIIVNIPSTGQAKSIDMDTTISALGTEAKYLNDLSQRVIHTGLDAPSVADQQRLAGDASLMTDALGALQNLNGQVASLQSQLASTKAALAHAISQQGTGGKAPGVTTPTPAAAPSNTMLYLGVGTIAALGLGWLLFKGQGHHSSKAAHEGLLLMEGAASSPRRRRRRRARR